MFIILPLQWTVVLLPFDAQGMETQRLRPKVSINLRCPLGDARGLGFFQSTFCPIDFRGTLWLLYTSASQTPGLQVRDPENEKHPVTDQLCKSLLYRTCLATHMRSSRGRARIQFSSVAFYCLNHETLSSHTAIPYLVHYTSSSLCNTWSRNLTSNIIYCTIQINLRSQSSLCAEWGSKNVITQLNTIIIHMHKTTELRLYGQL